MLEMSWITAISQLYSQVIDHFRNILVKRITVRLFDIVACCHYILSPPRILTTAYEKAFILELSYMHPAGWLSFNDIGPKGRLEVKMYHTFNTVIYLHI